MPNIAEVDDSVLQQRRRPRDATGKLSSLPGSRLRVRLEQSTKIAIHDSRISERNELELKASTPAAIVIAASLRK
jgi:hypothetical protein